MPNLGDYIGQLVSEMTMARMQADLEAVRVAELYASHPLLKHLPVPHFRLPEVELNVPVVVNAAPNVDDATSARGGITPVAARTAFDAVVDRVIRDENLVVSPDVRASMKSALDRAATVTAVGPTEVAVDVHRFSKAFSEAAMGSLKDAIKPQAGPRTPGVARGTTTATPEAVLERLKSESLSEMLKARKPPGRLGVLVHTSQVKEAGGPENLTQIRLKITESGFEWMEQEKDGTIERRLIEE